MKDLLLTYLDEHAWDKLVQTEHQRLMRDGIQFAQQLKSNGKFLGGAPLHPASAATSLRVRDGKRLLTDGPFAETREVLGGYSLLDVNDLHEAIDIATRLIGDGPATIEIRPVLEIPGLP